MDHGGLLCFLLTRTCCHLVFLLPEEVKGDGLHRAGPAQLAAKHLLQHADEVDMVLLLHGIVVVEVQEHHLDQSINQSINQPISNHGGLSVIYPDIYHFTRLFTSFRCLFRNELISDSPSLTLG